MISTLFRPATYRALFATLMLAAAAALTFALISQYGFGLRPCHLCLHQRYWYGGLIGCCALFFLGGRAWLGPVLAWLAGGLLMVQVGIAAYHSALERHWVAGPSECSGGIGAGMDIETLRAKILGAAVTRCDEPVWLLPGLSMANGNLILAAGLLAVTAFAIRRLQKDNPA